MRHNQAVAVAAVAVLLGWFDIVGFARFVGFVWPYFGPPALLFAVALRPKFRNASPAARAGLPRVGFAPYEFVGGDSVGLVFYPGAAIEAAAYAPLCRRVAEEAKATVILARPPFRAVITTRDFHKLAARHPGVETWAVGGHSHGAGSFGGMRIVNQTGDVRGLAMLGAVPTGDWVDLSARRDLEIVNVLASEDEICSPKPGARLTYGEGLVADGFSRLPKSTRRIVIKGGNHAGFGEYGVQAYDGERTISLEDQQSQVAKHLVAFLQRVRKRW